MTTHLNTACPTSYLLPTWRQLDEGERAELHTAWVLYDHTTVNALQGLATQRERQANYFPGNQFGDVYCPHLGAQLGPCAQCDHPDYLAYLADSERQAAEHAAEHGVHLPDYDTRHLEGPSWDDEQPFRHIPLVVMLGAGA